MTLTEYNLFKVFTNTKKGENIGNKTLKRIELERRREKESRVIVYFVQKQSMYMITIFYHIQKVLLYLTVFMI